MRIWSRILRRALFEWHVGRGLKSFDSGEYERALAHIESALSLVGDARLQVYRAISLLRVGAVEPAMQALSQIAVKSEVNHQRDVALLVLLARAYSELGIHGQVRNLCEAALKFDPRNIVAASLLALSLLEQGESDKALKALEGSELADDAYIQSRMLASLESLARERQAMELNMLTEIESMLSELQSAPAKPLPIVSAIASWWYSWRGLRYTSTQRIGEAIRCFTKALKHAPDNFNLRFALSILLLDVGMPKLAQMLLEDADAQQDQPDYHLLKGAIHLYLGEFENARSEFELADQSFALTHYYIGLCELYSGKPRDAVREFEIAFGLDPSIVRERIWELVKRFRIAA